MLSCRFFVFSGRKTERNKSPEEFQILLHNIFIQPFCLKISLTPPKNPTYYLANSPSESLSLTNFSTFSCPIPLSNQIKETTMNCVKTPAAFSNPNVTSLATPDPHYIPGYVNIHAVSHILFSTSNIHSFYLHPTDTQAMSLRPSFVPETLTE